MRIRSLEITSFRKFADGIRVSNFGDGLNILVAPNEYGKSTIVAALRGLVFEKHRAKTEAVRRMQTLGSETSPTLALDFDLAGERYRIEKRFLHRQPTALLTAGGRRFENDEAEEELQRLLGFGEPGKQGANDESRGIWGLLWLEQGRSFARPELSETGRGAIRSCLEQEVGALAGGERGTRILAGVDTAIRSFLDGRGKPTSDWKGLLDRIAALEASLAEARETRTRLTEELEALDTLRSERRTLDTDGEDGQLREDIAKTGKELDAAKLSEAQLGEARATLGAQKARLEAAEKEIGERGKLEEEVRKARGEADLARPPHAKARERTEELRSRRDAQVQEEGKLGVRLGALRVEETRLAQQRKLFACRNTISGLQEALDGATAAASHADELEARATAIEVTDAVVQRLKELEEVRGKAQADRDALATRIVLSLEPGALGRVVVDGVAVAERRVEALLTTPTRIDVEGIGSIEIRPGARDLEEAERALLESREELRLALAVVGAASLVDAESLLQKRKELQGEARAARANVATLTRARTFNDGTRVAAGLEALRKHVGTLRAAAEELEGKGVERTADGKELEAELSRVAEETARTGEAVTVARTRIDELAALLERTVNEEKRAADVVSSAEQRAALNEQQLERRREAESDEALSARRVALEEDRRTAQVAVTRMEAAGAGRDPLTTLEARLGRLEQARKGRQDRRQKIDLDVARLETSVSGQQGAGVDETIERREADLASLAGEKAFGERRLAALQLLAAELRRAEAEAKERYLAPVTERVQPYLAALLPGARVLCTERLELEAVERGGVKEELDLLSDGTREQIAVLTRLAFADLLLGSGRPAAVILDDSLAFSDTRRLERMFDILNEAAKKVQITVFSCRDRAFERLGANRLVVEPLGPVTSLPAASEPRRPR